MQTISCTRGGAGDMGDSTSPGSVIVLPDHCCWYGVACCGPDTCGNDPFCNCTIGTVTGLQLSNNQVRGGTCMECMASADKHKCPTFAF